MRRRRGGLGIFGFILFIMMFDLIDYGIDLLYYFMPLIVFGLVGFGFVKLFQNLFGISNMQQRRNTTYTQSNVRNAKLNSIDKVFGDYYKNNVSFVLFDDVSLCTKSGTYSTVDNLYVCYKDEKICQLSELKKTYPGAYEKIIEALGKVTKKDLKAMTENGKKKEESKKDKKEEKKKDAFSQAEEFIDKINSLNNNLNNEEVTNGLYQTCDLLKQIDVVDREDGTVDPKLNKLYEYYLPILEGILTDYKRLSESPIKGDDFKKCETQLVKTIKLINEALKIIYNSLHEADYMNLNADINTLQSLLKQDGYVDTPFNKEG
ncbi:MAG: hypothetical protein IJL85_02440 [Erysipelotrichaceae bacterium]|nr:hypothetical protein [Erysipelotrichaceae bacterium]